MQIASRLNTFAASQLRRLYCYKPNMITRPSEAGRLKQATSCQDLSGQDLFEDNSGRLNRFGSSNPYNIWGLLTDRLNTIKPLAYAKGFLIMCLEREIL